MPEKIRLLSRDDLDRTPYERRIAAIIRASYRDMGFRATENQISAVVRDVVEGGDRWPHHDPAA